MDLIIFNPIKLKSIEQHDESLVTTLKHLFSSESIRGHRDLDVHGLSHGLRTLNKGHKSKKSENLGRFGRQNMIWPFSKVPNKRRVQITV